jgi:gamma-glutamyltranspeptidase/glutathione hydrolase
MESGGNAVDAAIAANAVQGVVAPETCGVGGDLFALIHEPGNEMPAVLNASGRAGSGADPTALRDAGHVTVPFSHPEAVTVPGCVDGWETLVNRHGRLSLGQILEPAIRYATEGFAVSVELSSSLYKAQSLLRPQPSGRGFYPDGHPPRPGDRVFRPELAATLEDIAEEGAESFYQGRAGRGISQATDGRITAEDLSGVASEWVAPLALEVFGLTGWTVPPNSQGFLTLAAAWLFERLEPPIDPDHPDFIHLLIEAFRAVVWERDDVISDPLFSLHPAADLVSSDRLRPRLARIDRHTAAAWPKSGELPGGTAYLCVMDPTGMGVSLIQSNFTGFGGGIGVADAGFFLHNRGAGFNLRPGHPNELAPGKRPLHTLAPTLWTKRGDLAMLLGTRGGSYQPQILLQMVAHLLQRRLEPAEAQARPRWILDHDPEHIRLESAAGSRTAHQLAKKGHSVELAGDFERGWGPVSLIQVTDTGLRTAAADPRVPTALATVR